MNYFWNLLKNIDKTLLVLIACFAVISVVMVGSTAYSGEFVVNKSVMVQIVAYGLGVIALGAVLFFDYKIFESMEKIFYVSSILFLLSVYLPYFGVSHYGSRSWVNLGIVEMQPSELVKIFFILAFASFLMRIRSSLTSLKGVAMAFAYAAPIIVIVLKEDLGATVIFCFISVSMIFCAGVDYKLFAKLAGAVVVSMPILYRFMAGYQKDRIDAFLHPDNLNLPGNYQVWNSKIAIGSGGFWGKGLFQGPQKELQFVPVQRSDFIFSVIGEELGFLGGAFLIGLYALFLYRIAKIGDGAKDMYGHLVVIGLLGMFTFQIFENIGMNMGIMPVTGITLPFISYGGSSVVANMIALGIILNVGIRSKTINF